MPTFRLTQKLQKELGLKPGDLAAVTESDTPFAEWYAHVFTLDRRKQVIFVERQTLFSFTCENVTRKDLRGRWAELFEKGLGKALYIEEANAEVVKAVLEACRGEVRLAKTLDRRTIGTLNELIKNHKYIAAYNGQSSEDRDQGNRAMCTRGFPDKSKEYRFPLEVFADVVRQMFGLTFTPKDEEFQEEAGPGGPPSAQSPAAGSARALIFEVLLRSHGGDAFEEEVIREIVAGADETLYHLAGAIVAAFDFQFDHSFGFYSDLEPQLGVEPEEAYELFVDCPDIEPLYDHARGVEHTLIAEAFGAPGKQMRFLFDYGDNWEFRVTLKEVRPVSPGEKLPCVTRAVGRAPEQYPGYEEDDAE